MALQGEWQDQFIEGAFIREAPEGMTEKDFEQALINTAGRYKNTDEYFPLPGIKVNTSNSNSFVGTILREVYYGGADAMQDTLDNANGSFPLSIYASPQAYMVYNEQKNAQRFPNAQPDVSGAIGWNKDVKLEAAKCK